MKINNKNHIDFAQKGCVKQPQEIIVGGMFVLSIVALWAVLGIVTTLIFTAEQMYVIVPLLAAVAIFIIFSYVLWFRTGALIFGEIGFIYLVFALAYTILPSITFLTINFDFPIGFDNLNFSILSPQPEELGAHCWRHFLFIFGVATGYIAVRGGTMPTMPLHENSMSRDSQIVAVMSLITIFCVISVSLLSSPVATYWDHYSRFDHLSWSLRRFVYLCLIFKNGSYFILMTLMFRQYQKYRIIIFIIVPIICIYETVYSFGSRIETLTLLLAFIGFYHFKVNPISLKKGILYLLFLAILFTGIELIRSSDNSFEIAKNAVATEGIKSASEFGAIYYTGFHLYAERDQGNIPPRDWQMFFYEFISLIPFLDHTAYHPQYWYARHYFPNAIVPPQTMGVIVDSAIWGGEFDLFIRSLINGALFAMLTRWFLAHRNKWWACTIYIYWYATCVMTLKYSVLYQLIPFTRILIPVLLCTGILFLLQKNLMSLKSVCNETVD
ncbi:hypothetical protein [Desulfuromonas sp. TF]|uniref:hypothetical protein n=1 Tax=Desulfuromonas sp. TF TaxID=1232410 RepID=UPI00040CD052|nr:hypothetical protein [Desulfuromonas sp. TF]